MKLYNILENKSGLLKSIKLDCQEFMEDSEGMPLIKWCDNSWPDVHKIKVRKRKRIDFFTESFNSAFNDVYPSILNRSIIINEEQKSNVDEFFIFPIDGYKTLCNSEIKNSRSQLTSTFKDINEGIEGEESGEIIIDMLKASYSIQNIKEALLDNAEIIIYNIPVFYAVRSNVNYNNLMEMLKND